MIIEIENKSVHASDAGQGVDNSKDTIVFLHGSGLSHIVWSLTEQFFSSKNFNDQTIQLPRQRNSQGPSIESIEKKIFSLKKKANSGDGIAKKEQQILERMLAYLSDGIPARSMDLEKDDYIIVKSLQLLTSKPILYAVSYTHLTLPTKA